MKLKTVGRTYRLAIVLVITVIFGCKDEQKIPEAISKTPVELEVRRFDRAFAMAQPEDLTTLKSAYPYLFPAQYSDSIWVSKMQDSLQIELHHEVGLAFETNEYITGDLELLFKHIRYYFPQSKVPAVITLVSDVDYNNRVIMADTLLLIGLDNYLGADHRFYGGIDRYIAKELDKKYIVSDVAATFSGSVLKYPRSRTFLAQMIYYGKRLYLKDVLVPFIPEADRIKYSEEELTWSQVNEEEIWRYFIERELLYSTDNKLAPRFLDPAPFTKFRLELDNESPGRLGRYLGWQIVRAFMDNNSVTLEQLLQLPAEEIFNKSAYKPKK
jgi:gliding motility-associated lipoprotein GldB